MFGKIKAKISDLFGSSSEIAQSTEMVLKERIASPFYGYFALSWLIVNWDYLYAALFLDEGKIFDKTGMLQNEYLLQHILPVHHGWSWAGHFIFLPFLLTGCFIWIMPFITRPFYAQYIENVKKMEGIRIRATKSLVTEETQLIKEEIKKSQEEKRAVHLNPEILWKREYEEFKRLNVFGKFKQIVQVLYENDGLLNVGGFSRADSDMVMYADSHELIKLDTDKNGNRVITLTDKGRYFFRLYSSELNQAVAAAWS